MNIFERLGELIGNTFRTLFESISGLLRFKPEQLDEVDKELAIGSLDPDKFKTTEVKDLVKDLKEQLKTSPAGLSDWMQTVMGGFMAKIWDVAIGIMLPSKMETFEEAKASATWISNLFADFILLSAVLDMVGTALSATLVRNLIHIFRLFAATFGMDRYLDACIAPALTTSLVPMLTRGYNKQYRTYLPPATDLVSWQAREVFEPAMIEKYGLLDEVGAITRDLFYEQGLNDEQIENYWKAHWEHASWIQVVEMLRRGQLEERDVWDWFRLVEIPPFWRDKLINISYAVPTRVDVRRWWDMRTITEERLREVYAWQGYHGKDLDDYVLWTKVYVAFPDLMARFKNGWITEDDVRSELVALGMPSERVEEMIQTKIKTAEPERVTKERDLTKTDIYRGVKKGVISSTEGIELLQDMGYSEDEAEYIIAINVAAAEGSPETYSEYKQITQLYRKAMGLKAEIPPQELIEAGKALKEAKTTLEQVQTKERKDITETEAMQALSAAEYRYKQLLTQWQATKKS